MPVRTTCAWSAALDTTEPRSEPSESEEARVPDEEGQGRRARCPVLLGTSGWAPGLGCQGLRLWLGARLCGPRILGPDGGRAHGASSTYGREGPVPWRRRKLTLPDGEVKPGSIFGAFQWEDGVIPRPDWQPCWAWRSSHAGEGAGRVSPDAVTEITAGRSACL